MAGLISACMSSPSVDNCPRCSWFVVYFNIYHSPNNYYLSI